MMTRKDVQGGLTEAGFLLTEWGCYSSERWAALETAGIPASHPEAIMVTAVIRNH